MKAILYAGAVLMTGASIYGFIDYKKSSHNKEFQNLYKDPVAETDQQATETKTSVASNKPVETAKVESKKNEAIETTTKENGPVKNSKKMIANPVDPVKTEVIKTTAVTAKTNPVKKKKRLSYKLFSRAALDERMMEKEIKLQEPKKEEIKNQQ